jgi:hypothetical protein
LAGMGVVDRCSVVAGDFFQSVPGDGDAYILKNIIQCFPDERAVEILRNCREVMPSGATVLVVEPVMPSRVDSPAAFGSVMTDLDKLATDGGRERTLEEFRVLFAAAGLEVTRLAEPFEPTGHRVLEVVSDRAGRNDGLAPLRPHRSSCSASITRSSSSER